MKLILILLLLLLCGGSCASAALQHELYTHLLVEEDGLAVWTVPPSIRVFKDLPRPSAKADAVKVYAARGETEPFVLVLRTSASAVPLKVSAPAPLPAGVSAEAFRVEYVTVTQPSDVLGHAGDWPDPLVPFSFGTDTLSVSANENCALWLSLTVATDAVPGEWTLQVALEPLAVVVNVTLHVWNFAVPQSPSIKSQMNMGLSTVLSRYGVSGTGAEYWEMVDRVKLWMLQHRLQPSGPLWPGGLTSGGAPFIAYNCTSHKLSDPHGIWGFEQPARKYLLGEGFANGTGFRDFAGMWMRNNDASADQRPSSMCGLTRTSADWMLPFSASTPFNVMWLSYIEALQEYLSNLGLLDRCYFYLWNEPQDSTDYDYVAAYSELLKAHAPGIALMVSEEPKPEIHTHPSYPGAKIDIWLPVLNNYERLESWDRQANHGEESWVYFLTHNNQVPLFDPVYLDHQGVEGLFLGPFLWLNRIRGVAYYSFNDWNVNPWTTPLLRRNGDRSLFYPPSRQNVAIAYGSNGNRLVPSMRTELMRDSLELYEYLRILNGNTDPEPFAPNAGDAAMEKVVVGRMRAFTRDDEFLANLRRVVGARVAGESSSLDLSPLPRHPRALGPAQSIHINFQQVPASPFVYDNKTWMCIGWDPYDASVGHGWFGLPAQRMYGSASTSNPLWQSILYDDYGEYQSFQFDIPMAVYDVTVCVGWQGRNYTHNTVFVNGVSFFSEAPNNRGYLTVTKRMTLAVPALHVEIGCKHREYTMLVYMEAELVSEIPADCSADPCGANATCVPPGMCACAAGFEGDGHTCVPSCSKEEGCSLNGRCVAPGVCECNAGFVGDGITCKDPNAIDSSGDDFASHASVVFPSSIAFIFGSVVVMMMMVVM